MVVIMRFPCAVAPVLVVFVCLCGSTLAADPPSPRPHIELRAIYGGFPEEILKSGKKLSDYGVNAIFMGSGSLTTERVARLKEQGARVFAEFNSMHEANYLKEHPDAVPVGVSGDAEPPADGWQGVCPTHAGYRSHRMTAFRDTLERFEIDGIWLDYHHAHANWERAVPLLPDTCFCGRCLAQFQKQTGITLEPDPKSAARQLLSEHRAAWVKWRCDVFTDWVREYRSILDRTRPGALLGSFHCPWDLDDFEYALRDKLAIDLKAQAQYLDVFSPMPYHARFGHANDPAWIASQTAWLGMYLGISGAEKPSQLRIWPIVQLSDWGESVPVEQVAAVLDHGSRPPATGVIIFAWGSLRQQPAKIEEMGKFYKAIGSTN